MSKKHRSPALYFLLFATINGSVWHPCENSPLHLQRWKNGLDKLLPAVLHAPLPTFLWLICVLLYGYKASLCILILITLRWAVFTPFYRQEKNILLDCILCMVWCMNYISPGRHFPKCSKMCFPPVSCYVESKHLCLVLLLPPDVRLTPCLSNLSFHQSSVMKSQACLWRRRIFR